MQLPFVTVDVFTRTRFRGNPLAVVTVPATGPAPSQDQKQAIAREFNLSETVFVHEPRGRPDDPPATARRIDIFLTTAEIPFAGHPTIGAAVSLLPPRGPPAGIDCLVARAGPVPLLQTGPDAVRAAVPHDLRLHARRLRDLGPESLPATALAADPAVRAAELAAPVFSIVRGMAFALVELPDPAALAALRPAGFDLPRQLLLDDGWQHGFLARYYFVRMPAAASEDPDHDRDLAVVALRARMIEARFEDPATGSAASCLASYLSTVGLGDARPAPSRTRYDITQGVEMGKESNIVVEVAVKDSQVEGVSLEGSAVEVMRGTITV